jgi:hypothetical protein
MRLCFNSLIFLKGILTYLITPNACQKNNHLKIGRTDKIVFKYCLIVPIIKLNNVYMQTKTHSSSDAAILMFFLPLELQST